MLPGEAPFEWGFARQAPDPNRRLDENESAEIFLPLKHRVCAPHPHPDLNIAGARRACARIDRCAGLDVAHRHGSGLVRIIGASATSCRRTAQISATCHGFAPEISAATCEAHPAPEQALPWAGRPSTCGLRLSGTAAQSLKHQGDNGRRSTELLARIFSTAAGRRLSGYGLRSTARVRRATALTAAPQRNRAGEGRVPSHSG